MLHHPNSHSAAQRAELFGYEQSLPYTVACDEVYQTKVNYRSPSPRPWAPGHCNIQLFGYAAMITRHTARSEFLTSINYPFQTWIVLLRRAPR